MYEYGGLRRPGLGGRKTVAVVARGAAVLAMLGALAACAAPNNPMTAEQRQSLGITEINVTVLDDASIGWGEAERDFAASKGCRPDGPDNRASGEVGGDDTQAAEPADCDYDALIGSPEARAYLEARSTGILKDTLTEHVQPSFTGNVPARLSVKVREVFIVSTGRALLLGGSHVLRADLELTNLATGASLARYDKLYVTSGWAGGGPIGVLVEAASDDPFVRLSAYYADEAKGWLEGEDES